MYVCVRGIDVASFYDFLLVLELGTVVCLVVHKILLACRWGFMVGHFPL
jgi:hypothetical protein